MKPPFTKVSYNYKLVHTFLIMNLSLWLSKYFLGFFLIDNMNQTYNLVVVKMSTFQLCFWLFSFSLPLGDAWFLNQKKDVNCQEDCK